MSAKTQSDCFVGSEAKQLFSDDPMRNVRSWNPIYKFKVKISKEEFRAIEFFAIADAALRPGSINGDIKL